jgi:5-methylcytosine-specific restriction endonuclease McrA
MPIKAENKALYPPNWAAIRVAILARAGDRCESCGVPNKAFRLSGWDQWTFDPFAADEWSDAGKVSKIVLTIAHIHDPNPANCAPDNLRALCQRCHNRLDAPMRARHARTTRRQRLVCRELFDHG